MKKAGSLWNYYRYEPNNADNNTKNVEIVVPLRHLSNFWRTLDMPLINCEVSLILTWSKNCVLIDMPTRDAEGNNSAIAARINATFTITDARLYVAVVTLSTQDDNKLLEQLES